MNRQFIFALFLVAATGLLACADRGQESVEMVPAPTPKNAYIKHSTWYAVVFENGYCLVTVRTSAEDSVAKRTYILAADLKQIPSNILGTRIQVPIKSMALTSTTQIPLAVVLGEHERIVGFPHLEYIRDPQVKNQIGEGLITDIAGEKDVDLEKLMALQAEIIMVYPWAGSDYERMEEAGTIPVYNCDYLEPSPLGRAEWIKLMGLLTNKKDIADSIFAGIERRYMELHYTAMLSSSLPSVLAGDLYNGIWYAPGGNSYIAQFIKDAGANYLWQQNESVASIELDFEAVYEKAVGTSFWGTVTSMDGPVTRSYFLNQNELFKDFKAYQDTALFACNSREVDYFGKAVLEPDVILADLICIFHPTYLPDHKPTYFFKVK